MTEEDLIPETGAVFTYGKSEFADNIPSHFFIRNDPVVEISCGDEHSGIVCRNGRVFCFGRNTFGQLGLGHKENVYKPNCVKSLKPEKIKHVACGRSHTIVSTENGVIYGFGDNSNGQLGQPVSTDGSSIPIQITKFDDNIIQLAAGSHHTAALIENGDVYVWGSNSEKQLGVECSNGSFSVRTPTIVSIFQPVVYISCGSNHSAFVTKTGDLHTCGNREYGKLGHDFLSLHKVDFTERIIQVSCGANHTIALNDSGKVFVCGINDCGQIGLKGVTSQGHLYPCSITNERIVSIKCGDNHSAFITASGKLFTCGDGKYGKLCVEVDKASIPVLVTDFVNRQLKVQMVSCGANHTLVHAEPAEDDPQADNFQIKNTLHESLPPLKIQKKTPEKCKEQINVSQPLLNENEEKNYVVKDSYKEIIVPTTNQLNSSKDKINDHHNAANETINKYVNEKSTVTQRIDNNQSMNTNDEQLEVKNINKFKYPKNARVKSRLCAIL
ncbi:X-linked retinitis pigmentosa GTPase regulator-like [Daktulosphaira vitifoliae]|uniref:X-linked retinitis pigmentosa GTPase regulator-like n=1 Tax=Daktulosphaira vitifoliae TaxID=58002 RepID=UPI0021A9ED1E|nr:X-linked retinitis pigmentosa GTPase regulator-like [Daktulosphaira vitifoliae]